MSCENPCENDYLKSTYSTLYKKCPSESDYEPKSIPHEPAQFKLSVIKNEGLVKLKQQSISVRSRKYVRPPGLARDFPICLGLGRYSNPPLERSEKPIVQSHRLDKKIIPPPQKPMKPDPCAPLIKAREMLDPNENLDEMIARISWIPSTRHQQEQGSLSVPQRKIPSSTIELNADVVRYRPMRYRSSAQQWQKTYSSWNKSQTRPLFNNPNTKFVDHPKYDDEYYAMRRRLMRNDEKPKIIVSGPNFPEIRHIPRYGGFIPREPTEPYYQPADDQYFSTSSSEICKGVLTKRDPACIHQRKAPMSRMITLVNPANPFKLARSMSK